MAANFLDDQILNTPGATDPNTAFLVNRGLSPNSSSTLNNYWFGVVANGIESIGDHENIRAAHILRGLVYIDELGWLPESCRDEDGCEFDDYDPISTHVALIDVGTGKDRQAIANIRYINALGGAASLPVEQDFNLNLDPKEDKVEISRLMSRNSDSKLRTLGSIAVISHAVGELTRNGVAGYATLEKKLLRLATKMGISAEIISGPIELNSYGSTINYAVRIDGPKSVSNSREIAIRRTNFPFARFFDIAVNGTNDDLLGEIRHHIGI